MNSLSTIEQLAEGHHFQRFLYNPVRYIFGIVYSKLIFPIFKKGTQQSCTTYFNKKMDVLLPAGLDIFLLGAKTHNSEIRLARFLHSHLKDGDVFCDVGAHFGYFSLLAAQRVGDAGQVIAIEASSQIFRMLKANVETEKNIEIHHLACGKEDGTISFSEFPLLYSEYNTLYPAQFEKTAWVKKYRAKQVQVPIKKLDTLFSTTNFKPNMIKIDTEGAEYDVILGCAKLLSQVKPIIILEYLFPTNTGDIYHQAGTALIQSGYECHIINADGSLRPMALTAIPDYFSATHTTSDNIVFLPL